MGLAVYKEDHLKTEPSIRCGGCGRIPRKDANTDYERITHAKDCDDPVIVCVFGPNSVRAANEYESEEFGEPDYSGKWRGMYIVGMRRLQRWTRESQRSKRS